MTQRIARDLYDRNLPDLTAVYFAGTDEVGHVFAPFTPPRLECAAVSDADVARFSRVSRPTTPRSTGSSGSGCAGPKRTGPFSWCTPTTASSGAPDRPCGLALGNWATAAFWHRPDGVLAAWGAGCGRARPRARPASSTWRRRSSPFSVCRATQHGGQADRRPAFDRLAPRRRRDLAGDERRAAGGGRPMRAAESDEYAKKLLAPRVPVPAADPALAATGGARPGMTEGAWNNLGMYERETASTPPPPRRPSGSAGANPGYYSPMFNLAVLAARRERTRARRLALPVARRGPRRPRGDDPALVPEYDDRARGGRPRRFSSAAPRAYPDNEAIARELASVSRQGLPGRAATSSAGSRQTRRIPRRQRPVLFQTCLGRREEASALFERSLR